MLKHVVTCLSLAVLASACVATPSMNSGDAPAYQMSQEERDLRNAVRSLDARYEEAGWSDGNVGESAMRFAQMLMHGASGRDPQISRSDAYLSRIESRASDVIAASVLTDMDEAHALAAQVTTLALTVAGLQGRPRELLAADLTLTERAIADVGRAIDLFEGVSETLAGNADEAMLNQINAKSLAMRQELTRMGEAADALSERRRQSRDRIIG